MEPTKLFFFKTFKKSTQDPKGFYEKGIFEGFYKNGVYYFMPKGRDFTTPGLIVDELTCLGEPDAKDSSIDALDDMWENTDMKIRFEIEEVKDDNLSEIVDQLPDEELDFLIDFKKSESKSPDTTAENSPESHFNNPLFNDLINMVQSIQSQSKALQNGSIEPEQENTSLSEKLRDYPFFCNLLNLAMRMESDDLVHHVRNSDYEDFIRFIKQWAMLNESNVCQMDLEKFLIMVVMFVEKIHGDASLNGKI